jgi:anti-anti-sigma factor
MHVTVETKTASPSAVIVALTGEHDVGDYGSLRIALARAAIRAPNVVVDLSRCEFIDSTVVGTLLRAESVVARDRGRFLAVLPKQANAVIRIADLIGLAEVLPTSVSVEAALASFQPGHNDAQPV